MIFYGDKNNWYAAYSFWLFKLYGHTDAAPDERRAHQVGGRGPRVHQGHANSGGDNLHRAGGRIRAPRLPPPGGRHCCARAGGRRGLVDVRSPDEYTGKLIHMMNYPQEGAQRGGHIPGAQNIPWATRGQSRQRHVQVGGRAARASTAARASRPDKDVIAYCRIGERSAHTWFVADTAARLPERAQLRWLVDRVGQPGRRAHRQGRGARRVEQCGSPQRACSGVYCRLRIERSRVGCALSHHTTSYFYGKRVMANVYEPPGSHRVSASTIIRIRAIAARWKMPMCI